VLGVDTNSLQTHVPLPKSVGLVGGSVGTWSCCIFIRSTGWTPWWLYHYKSSI